MEHKDTCPRKSLSPAWQRLSRAVDPGARLLLLAAPRGFGRHRAASDWLAGGGGRLIDLSAGSAPADVCKAADEIERMLAEHPATRFAVLLRPGSPAGRLVCHPDGQLLTNQDLRLSMDEVRAVLSAERPENDSVMPGLPAEDIWHLTGGWLWGVLSLARDAGAAASVVRDLRRALHPWLARLDPGGALAESAFLPTHSAEDLSAFYSSRGAEVPGLLELADAALVHADGAGGWAMPELVRQALQSLVRSRDPQQAEALEEAALRAAAATGQAEAAVQAALARNRWSSLWALLADRWLDLFMSNPRLLRTATAALPGGSSQPPVSFYAAILKIMAAAGKDRFHVPFPTVEPVYAADHIALWLREQTEQHSRHPDATTLAVSLLELGILRFHGHHRESADAGRRLRDVVNRATGALPIRPALASMAELNAGICLHIGDSRAEALRAYEAAFHWASAADNAFLLTNSAGNIALVHAQDGNTQAARKWLDRADRSAPGVRWARDMVAQGANLARCFIAMHDLDQDAWAYALSLLPDEPDADEFWAVHAEVLSLWDSFYGSPETARQRIEDLERQRPYAARSPLARRAFGHALASAQLMGDHGFSRQRPLGRHAEQQILYAYWLVSIGERDGALRALRYPDFPADVGLRPRFMSRNLQFSAIHPAELPIQALTVICANHRSAGDLLDLSVLWQNPAHRRQLSSALALTEAQRARLDFFLPSGRAAGLRPQLTEREAAILAALRQGRSKVQIATEQQRSLNTIKTQVNSLYRKLGASTRLEALARAAELGY